MLISLITFDKIKLHVIITSLIWHGNYNINWQLIILFRSEPYSQADQLEGRQGLRMIIIS